LARALCASGKLLALDEPAAGLDPLVTAEVYRFLKKINQEMGVTIIMVSHDIEAAVEYANKILHVKNRQCFFGSTAEYLRSETGKQFLPPKKEV
jgi:zinc transport system ATP-binding protein